MATEGPGGPGWKATAITAEVTSVLHSVGATGDFKWGSDKTGAR